MRKNFRNIIGCNFKQGYIFLYIILVLSIFLFTHCDEMQQQIDWEAKNTDEMIVVEGAIVSDLCYQCIKLSLSDDYFANKPSDKISDASVIVSDGANTYTFFELDTFPGFYYSEYPFAGEAGRTYTLSSVCPKRYKLLYNNSLLLKTCLNFIGLYCV